MLFSESFHESFIIFIIDIFIKKWRLCHSTKQLREKLSGLLNACFKRSWQSLAKGNKKSELFCFLLQFRCKSWIMIEDIFNIGWKELIDGLLAWEFILVHELGLDEFDDRWHQDSRLENIKNSLSVQDFQQELAVVCSVSKVSQNCWFQTLDSGILIFLRFQTKFLDLIKNLNLCTVRARAIRW